MQVHKSSRTVQHCTLVAKVQDWLFPCYHRGCIPPVHDLCSLHHYLHSKQDVVVQYIMNESLFSVLLTSRSCISCSFVASLITKTFSRLVDSCCCCFNFSPVSKSPASSSRQKKKKENRWILAHKMILSSWAQKPVLTWINFLVNQPTTQCYENEIIISRRWKFLCTYFYLFHFHNLNLFTFSC